MTLIKEFKPNDRVNIAKSSEFYQVDYDSHLNPTACSGTVCDVRDTSFFTSSCELG